jgi:formate hydrogenlyase transcriptional activator
MQQRPFYIQSIDRDLNYSDVKKIKINIIEDPRIEAFSEALLSDELNRKIVGESEILNRIKRDLQEVAWTDMTVLILGETGTGKGIAAKAIHDMSDRKDGAFIHVNCGAISDGLIDSEFFGHEKGAFTGAISRKVGKFELANGGTIFLDEIGELPIYFQSRLLKVIQDRRIERVGSVKELEVDVRLIAATNRDIESEVKCGNFRKDLYFRLNVFPITMPPLRNRRGDVPDLVSYFVHMYSSRLNRKVPNLSLEVMNVLIQYNWPGNVRELENVVYRSLVTCKDNTLLPCHFPNDIAGIETVRNQVNEDSNFLSLVDYERNYLSRVLRYTKGVIHGKRGAAEILNINPTTLRSRLKKLGISGADFKKDQNSDIS